MLLRDTQPCDHNVGRISSGNLSFFAARNRHEAYNVFVRAFKKSSISQQQLAERVGLAPAVVSRLLARPRNIELDTLSKLIFGLTGAALRFDLELPNASIGDNKTPRNETSTETLVFEPAA